MTIRKTQLERLAFIEFTLIYTSRVGRAELMAQFNIGPASATRSLSQYEKLCPLNMYYDPQKKTYRANKAAFNPANQHFPINHKNCVAMCKFGWLGTAVMTGEIYNDLLCLAGDLPIKEGN